jgi:nucleoid-associated protein YgaU
MANKALSLTLGAETFSEFEIPESIPLGGAQQLVIHKLPGGARVMQAMGPDDDPIQWSGLFLGASALDRARAIDLMRVQGKPQQLAFFEFKYKVIVKGFRYVVERRYRIRYTLELEVIEDSTRGRAGAAAAGLGASIGADSAAAVALGGKIGDSKLSSLLGAMDGAIKSVSNIAQATTATINSVLGPVAAVAQRAKDLISTASSTLSSVSTLGGILPNNPIARQVARLNGQVAAATQLPLLYNVLSLSGRIQSNLALVSGAASSATRIVAAGQNLFSIAAAEYGDATKWTAIAQANKLTDPNVSGIQTLTIPPAPADGGGVFTA